ncbi:hypothetical protein [Planctomicrobium piriforme]|uniref:Uncharacterized protein n=1 Tax=Planctomicrobium piriforme TaxID=1576369 RepID=A0A1I3IID8_9PLAN|nr:hypothetical protein [Planctomicrobium piriforme]SFI47639.1 hypothetical protein SAMN05421753_109134 [Planctomicrobium piriforme]
MEPADQSLAFAISLVLRRCVRSCATTLEQQIARYVEARRGSAKVGSSVDLESAIELVSSEIAPRMRPLRNQLRKPRRLPRRPL